MKKVVFFFALACVSQFFGCVRPEALSPMLASSTPTHRTVTVTNCNGTTDLSINASPDADENSLHSLSIYYTTESTYSYQLEILDENNQALVYSTNFHTNIVNQTPNYFQAGKTYEAILSGVCPNSENPWVVRKKLTVDGGGGVIILVDAN